jgi:hypothetical protein
MPLVGRRNRTKAIFIAEGLRLLSSGRSSGQGRQPIRGQRPKDPKAGGAAGFAPKCGWVLAAVLVLSPVYRRLAIGVSTCDRYGVRRKGRLWVPTGSWHEVRRVKQLT